MYGGFVVRGKLQKVIPVGANKTKEDVQKRALQIWDEFGKKLGESKSVNEEILKPGTKVKVQHKGKTVSGKIVRYDSKTPGSPFYVVYTGQYDSIEVPAYQVKKESVSESVTEGKFEPNFAKKIEAILKRELGVNKLEVTGPRTGRVMNRQSYYFHIPNPTHWVVVQKSQYGGPYPDDYYVALTNSLGQEKEETVVDHITDENVVLKTVSALAKKYKKQLTDTRMKESVKEKK